MSNESLFAKAQQFIPAGVNSPVRAFRAVGGAPRFIARGEGACIWDTEGRRYIDYIGSWGALVAGHAHPEVVAAVCAAACNGLSFGAPTEAEIEMAELLCQLLPGMELVRLVSSGTEATMTALRLARGHTGRNRVIKFEGCYHGHADSLLVKAGSGALTFGQPSSSGVPPELAALTLVLDYNDAEQLARTFTECGAHIAAVIVEPVAGNMNLVAPEPEFLRAMRELCTKYGAVLILDEVMTGFRVGLTGAQGRYGIQPDLTTLGKVIGGGMPVGAFGGSRGVMAHLAPDGDVYQAGTLSGNPVAMAAGLTTLDLLSSTAVWHRLEELGRMLEALLKPILAEVPFPVRLVRAGSLFWLSFHAGEAPRQAATLSPSAIARFAALFHAMLARGVYLPPSAYEVCFLSASFGEEDLQYFAGALKESLGVASNPP